MEPIYEKTKPKEDCILRVSELLFDFRNSRLPPWYPIQKGTRICCHHHLHEKIEFLFVTEGTVIFQISGTPYVCHAGDFLLVNPFEPHSGTISPDCDIARYYAFNLDTNLLKKFPGVRFSEIIDPLLSGAGSYPHTLPASDSVGTVVREELKTVLATRQDQNSELYQIASVCRIFAALGAPIVSPSGGGTRSADFVRRCILYIQSNDPRAVSLEAISRTFSYNKAYFTTLFRKHFGVPFTDFLNRYKIENAHALIRGGNRNLSEVSRLSRFNYYAYFFRKFKEVSGMTPSEYIDFCDSREKK